MTVTGLTRRALLPSIPPLRLSTSRGSRLADAFGSAWMLPALLLIAIALRAPLYGNPVIHSDEQFYLLVGDRMLAGQWPYLDIWDRKPVGLFLIYAAIGMLGGDGILAYQLVATIAAALTALIVARMAMAIGAAPRAGFSGAVAYLIGLMLFDGGGGQSPVFYNLAMAGAGATVLKVVGDLPGRPVSVVRYGAPAMLLVGLALQIKYCVVFEGAFLGLALVWALARTGSGLRTILTISGGLALLALAPTLLAWAVYAANGAGWTFAHANFLSVFQRGAGVTATSDSIKLAGAAAGLGPLLWLAWRGWRRSRATLFMMGWAAVSLAAILLVGTFEAHYFLPLLVPLAALAAPGMPRGKVALGTLVGIALIATTAALSDRIARRGDRAQVERLVAMIRPHLDGCLFVFGSEPILYHLTGACMPTRYAFRSHLSQLREANAIGVDPVEEVARVIATRPAVVVVRQPRANSNPATLALLRGQLERQYRAIGWSQLGKSRHYVFVRR